MLLTRKSISGIVILLLFLSCGYLSRAQPDFSIDLKKPEKFENKELGSERLARKKFTLPRRFAQNTYTHYNYYFNAQNKLNYVLEQSKYGWHDDYSELLSFYNYDLEGTSSFGPELDSVIYKSTAGILLHDLRNSWIDNLYLLIGKAYILKKEFDSANLTLQFLNYNFYPRDKNEYNVTVGSSDNAENGGFTIFSKEKRDLLHKIWAQPPSRNDALLWMIRSYIEQGDVGEASSLIHLLKSDAHFPERLEPRFEEMQAYYFYKQQAWDSTAKHLIPALEAAENLQDKARWEFLLGQLYTLTGDTKSASKYYGYAMHHTTEPMLDIFARLNDAQLNSTNDPESIKKTIEVLKRMGRRDKFSDYKDILYYAAAKMALDIPDSAAAKDYLVQSTTFNAANFEQKNKSYLLLADIALDQKDYELAAKCYDSLNFADPALKQRAGELEKYKAVLGNIVADKKIIAREDSLQRVAKMPEADRTVFIKDLIKKLRKERGLKEEPAFNPALDLKKGPPDLFAGNTSKGGEWYFYNPSVKSSGLQEFKAKWGARPNVDNWRRKADIDAQLNTVKTKAGTEAKAGADSVAADIDNPAELSEDALTANLPLTPEKLKASHDNIINALFDLGNLYMVEMSDYKQAAATFEELNLRYNNYPQQEETIFNLYYCWLKAGDINRSEYYKSLTINKYPDSKYGRQLSKPKGVVVELEETKETKEYDKIYRAFIEGDFEKALENKKTADSLYGETYWTPQLLYIESMAYVKERKDSAALATLTKLIDKFPGNPMVDKATAMVDVLHRRKEIESYLTNLEIKRYAEDEKEVYVESLPPDKIKRQVNDTTRRMNNIVVRNNAPRIDSLNAVITRDAPKANYVYNNENVHAVLMVLSKVDPIFATEAKNAFTRFNKNNFDAQNISIANFELNKESSLLSFTEFYDEEAAMKYVTELKQRSAREIVPWLPADKYSFLIISVPNLELLKERKDINEYRLFLEQHLPGKF